jgi:glycosyltransferase involved in cell wall biosynthesis
LSPEVTIILPVKDGEEFLRDALESLCGQTLGGWRCLLLDDNSSDGTPVILEEYAKRDGRFEVSTSAKSLGVPRARQRLLEAVRTPYVAIMDADDVCHPRRLELQLNAAKANPTVALWGSNVAPLGAPTPGWLAYLGWLNSIGTPHDILLHLFTDNPLAHPTWFGRTEAFIKVGGYRDGPFAEDYDLLLRLVGGGFELGTINEPLLGWRDHPRRQTRTNQRYDADALMLSKAEHFPGLYRDDRLPHLPNKDNRPLAIYGAGKTGRILVEWLRNRGMAVACFIDPMKAGGECSNIPIVGPEQVAPGEHLILAAVRPVHLRKIVKERLEGLGHLFGRDYLWFY